MARCPDCNKFVGINQEDPETNLEITDESITGDIRLVLTCADCGAELMESNQEVNIPFEFIHKTEGCDGTLELEGESADSMDEFEGKGRGARHFYGADISADVKCSKCGEVVHVEGNVREQASYFDSMV